LAPGALGEVARILRQDVSGKLRASVGKRRYRLQEQSLSERLKEHLTKVATERAKVIPNENLIRYWEREIKTLEMGIARARRKQGKK
jgi:hypothetical protein